MQTTQGGMLQSLRVVQAFLDTNADTLSAVVKTGARQQLADAIAALLRDHMAPISRVARAELPVTTEVEPLRMPQGKPSVERLAAAAKGMAKAAQTFSPVFISAGLPLDFVDQLNTAADAYEYWTAKRALGQAGMNARLLRRELLGLDN